MASPIISTILFPLLGGVFPALLWLWFWLKEDIHPEPKKIVVAAFVAGAFSTLIALPLQKIAPHFVGGSIDHPSNLLLFLWAGAEELAKYIAAAIVALSSGYFDEPVDAMIYMISVSTGFAAFENTLFLVRDFAGGNFFQLFVTSNTRFLGATLLHIVASTVVGGFLALAFYKRPPMRVMYTTFGLLLGTTLHMLFNFFILHETGNGLLTVLLYLWVTVLLVFLLFEKVKHLKQPKNT